MSILAIWYFSIAAWQPLMISSILFSYLLPFTNTKTTFAKEAPPVHCVIVLKQSDVHCSSAIILLLIHCRDQSGCAAGVAVGQQRSRIWVPLHGCCCCLHSLLPNVPRCTLPPLHFWTKFRLSFHTYLAVLARSTMRRGADGTEGVAVWNRSQHAEPGHTAAWWCTFIIMSLSSNSRGGREAPHP